jgi:hypothetical protein
MKYEAVPQISREQYEEMIGTNDPAKIASALLSISYWDRDWNWVQEQLLSFTDHPEPHIRYTAVVGFGHVARFNGQLDCNRVEPILKRMATQDDAPEKFHIRGTVEDSLEDIEIFIHRPRREHRKFEPARRLN